MSDAYADAGKDNFRFEPADDLPGWMTWDLVGDERFNGFFGGLRVRAEGPGRSRVRMLPALRHSNFFEDMHGGALLGFMDMALFPACAVHDGIDLGRASTIDLTAQFMRGARIGIATDAVIDILRETRRLVFLRGLIEQAGEACASFSGTIRKASRTSDARQ